MVSSQKEYTGVRYIKVYISKLPYEWKMYAPLYSMVTFFRSVLLKLPLILFSTYCYEAIRISYLISYLILSFIHNFFPQYNLNYHVFYVVIPHNTDMLTVKGYPILWLEAKASCFWICIHIKLIFIHNIW